jgi:hypothetical protein
MQQSRCDEDALLHALRIVGERSVLGSFQREELQERARLGLDELLLHSAQAADELQVFEAGEMGVDLRLLGDVAKLGAEGGKIVVDVAAGEEDLAPGRLDHANDHLDRGRLA